MSKDSKKYFNALDDFIMIVDGTLPQSAIDQIMHEYETSDAWQDYHTGHSGGNTPATSILLSHPTVIQNSPVRENIKTAIANYIFPAFEQYHKKYSGREDGENMLSINELVGLRLIRYEKGQSIFKHVDKYTDPDTNVKIWPVVTFTLALNNDYTGGDLELLDGRYVFKCEPGQCVFFPSNFLFPHEVKTVTSGIRYAIVGWFV